MMTMMERAIDQSMAKDGGTCDIGRVKLFAQVVGMHGDVIVR